MRDEREGKGNFCTNWRETREGKKGAGLRYCWSGRLRGRVFFFREKCTGEERQNMTVAHDPTVPIKTSTFP